MTLALINSFPASNKSQKPTGPRCRGGGPTLGTHTIDVDLMTCMWTSPWIWFAVDATVRDFRECFEKSLYGRNPLLTIQNLICLSFHGTSNSPPMKGIFNGSVTANV